MRGFYTVEAKRFLDSASEMEQFRGRLETMQHSAVTARETISEMVSQAASSPLELEGLVEASVQLEALGQNSRTRSTEGQHSARK